MQIEDLGKATATQVANLHIFGIATGFISSLGEGFVVSLYEAIAQSKSSFGLVVVADEAQGKGIAKRLIDAGLEECRNRGIDKLKVLVAADNEPANNLYQKCGFELVTQINSHGINSIIYVKKTVLDMI